MKSRVKEASFITVFTFGASTQCLKIAVKSHYSLFLYSSFLSYTQK